MRVHRHPKPLPRRFLLCCSLLSLLICGACATLPKIEEIVHSIEARRHPWIVGPRGAHSSETSRDLLRRLEERVAGTEILERHTVVMESVAGKPLTSGNRSTLLIDGPATILAMVKAIREAKDHINFETFIFSDDETGRLFADLLLQKQAEGVQVNLIYDSVGCRTVPTSFFQQMRDGGIQALEFNPVNPSKTRGDWMIAHRDHRKILIIDGRIAFAGGVNIYDAYSTSSIGYWGRKAVRPWRDTHLRIEGPVVAEFQKLFLETWTRQQGPELLPRNYFPGLGNKGRDLVRVVDSTPLYNQPVTYVMYLFAFIFAEKSIYLTSSYFVPNDDMVGALKDAARRGVDVKIILPSSSDVGVVFYAGRSFYTELLQAGVQVYERRGTVLHAKTAVVDGAWSTVGSTNLDLWSFMRNDEVNTIILGGHFAEEMEIMFQRDLAESKPILLESWEQRPASERLKEWATRLLRFFL
jgi:cardiolipin synthase A/B